MTAEATDRDWLRGQVAAYRRRYQRYVRYGKLLDDMLEGAAKEIAPLAIVTHRPKSISSFAEKCLRKRAKYHDPVNQLTDLCGARIMVRTRSEADRFCRWIEENFTVDEENSDVASERLRPTEFGYRGVHYVVSLKSGDGIPKTLLGLKAELQVRTTLEHAWADFGHDLSYKGAFELPERWVRDLAVAAAELEDIDHDFTRIEDGMRVYATTYGSYLGEEGLANELAMLEAVLEYDEDNPVLAWRVGKLAMRLGEWGKAVEVMRPYVDPKSLETAYQPLLRDLGVSLCKRHQEKPSSPGFRRGRRFLEAAAHARYQDTDALSSLAGTWRGMDEAKAHELYRQAFELDPTGYYALANYLEFELRAARSTALLAPLRPTIAAAMERARAHAEVGINLPWALSGQAKLHLLLGEPYDALRAYAKAVRASTAPWMVESTLHSVERLSLVSDELEGYEWVRTMLLLGLAAKFRSANARRRLRRRAGDPIEEPVVIVVGGTHPDVEERMHEYRQLMLRAFRDFEGTTVCGGTKQGVSGLVGEVGKAYAKRIRTVAYVPTKLPDDAKVDRRYRDLRRTDSDRFTPLEPLQAWVDLVASGVKPENVKVLGINGGDIASIEFRVALALGALVGVLEESGRAAARLLADEAWTVSERLVPLPEDEETVRAFIGSGRSRLTPKTRDTIGGLIHEEHRKETAETQPAWSALQEDLRESSRLQADDIFAKLREIGCGVREVKDRPIVRMTFTPEERERLSEMEHGRFNAERLSSGWRWGPEKDRARKISSSLVSWEELPEEERKWDRATVEKIPMYLEAIGLEIYRET